MPIAVAVVLHGGKVLIGRRPEGVPLSGLWEFPGGKVRPGESLSEATARECREETGLEIRVGQPFPPVVHQYAHGRVCLTFFAAEPIAPNLPPKEPFRWVPLADLRAYPFPPANAPIVEQVLRQHC